MSLARFFSKPRWQSKDAATRRHAVATEQASELVAQLARFAREDADAGVRLAAMKRLADPGLAQAMAQDDGDEGVRNAARNLFAELLTGTHAAAPPLADRIRLLRAQDDARLIEQIATQAPEAALRLAALARVERPALILERVTADADAAVRLAALERIDDESQLARISERARKGDKVISRLAGERLAALRIGRGDVAEITVQARSLCEQLERLLREGEGDEQAATIAAAWQALGKNVPPALLARYQSARELFELSRDPERIALMRQRSEDRLRLGNELRAIEAGLREPASAAREELQQRFNTLAELHARYANDEDEFGADVSVRFTRVGAQLATLAAVPVAAPAAAQAETDNRHEQAAAERAARSAAARAEREQKEKELARQMQEAISATAIALAAGKTAEAHVQHEQLAKLRRQLGQVPAALREALADVESNYIRLADAQRWSDDKRRQQLCEELEVLPEAGLHPDALATRVREIQAEWTTLDRLEAHAARRNDGLARRFRALCQKAIAPAKPYFEKRDELRKQGSEETSQLIAEAREAVAVEDPDWRALAAMRKRSVEGLRTLDRVNPRERKNLAAELKQVLGIIDERIKTQHAQIESAKAALIARAAALAEQADTRTAMNQARDLQKLWQAAGNGKRARDQAQWVVFRAAIDAVFARADSERAERTAQDRQAVEAAESLCAELEAVASANGAAERSEVQRIESAWRALAPGDAALRQRFQRARDALEAFQAKLDKDKRRAHFDAWIAHYDLLRQFETRQIDGEALTAARARLAPLVIGADAFQARIEALADGSAIATADADDLRDCVLEAEQLAGLESAGEDRQRRMDLQVEKLAARMRGVQAPAAAAALEELMTRWIELGLPGDGDGEREARFKRAAAAILDTLG